MRFLLQELEFVGVQALGISARVINTPSPEPSPVCRRWFLACPHFLGMPRTNMDPCGSRGAVCKQLHFRFHVLVWVGRDPSVKPVAVPRSPEAVSLRVQVPNKNMLSQILYYNYYYSKPSYSVLGPSGYFGMRGTLSHDFRPMGTYIVT